MAKPAPDPSARAGNTSAADDAAPATERPLPPAAQRALAEAAERRAARERDAPRPSGETPARRGPDPVRYGDWEVNGIASDF